MYGVFLCICFTLSLARTQAAIPTPSGLHVDIINTTTVVARWNPIPKEHVISDLLGYIVELKNYNPSWQLFQTIKTNETSIVVKDLKDWLRYEIRVHGYSVTETGSYSFIYFYTPAIPTPSGLDVDIINTTTVVARWDPIPQKHVIGDLHGYIVKLMNYYSWQLFQTITTNETSIVVKDLKDWSRYRMHVYGYSAIETGSYSYISFYTPTMPSPSGLSFTKRNLTTMEANWDPIPKEHVKGVLLGYIVQLREMHSLKLLKKFHINETSIVIKDLQLRLNCNLYVQGYTSNETGRSSHYRFYTHAVAIPTGLKVTINKTTLFASWDPIPKRHILGILLGYDVRIDTNMNGWVFQYFKTNTTSIVIKDLHPGTGYRLVVSGYTARDTWSSSHFDFVTSCGGIIENQLQGNIIVRGYSYGLRINCAWQIQGQRSDSMILIIMESLSIPASYNCSTY